MGKLCYFYVIKLYVSLFCKFSIQGVSFIAIAFKPQFPFPLNKMIAKKTNWCQAYVKPTLHIFSRNSCYLLISTGMHSLQRGMEAFTFKFASFSPKIFPLKQIYRRSL